MEIDIALNTTKVKNLSLEDNSINQNQNSKLKSFLDSSIEIIQESFQNFLTVNSINNNSNFSQSSLPLTRESFEKWDFIKDLEERHSINLHAPENLIQIPYLNEFFSDTSRKDPNSLKRLQRGQLIKFNCMVQNVFENQLYMAAGYDKTNNNKLILNKFFDYSNSLECTKQENEQENSNKMLIDENSTQTHINNQEEDLYNDDCGNYSNSLLMERLVLNCVIPPGMSSALEKQLKYEENSKTNLSTKKIILYDYQNISYKVNEEIFIIGLAYETESEIIIHGWKTISDYLMVVSLNESLKFLQNFNLQENIEDPLDNKFYLLVREKIFSHFKNLLNNDELLSEYLVLLLTSQIFSRVGTHLIGKLSLNIINVNGTGKSLCDFYNSIFEFIKLISNYTVTYTPTIKSLNKDQLYPRFDVNTEELHQGILQTLKNTFVIIDERFMNEGKLENIGCKNFSVIKNLIEFQTISYEYPYTNVEIHHDTQILIVSDKIKSIFNSPGLVEVPFMNCGEEYDVKSHLEKVKDYEKFFNSENSDEFMLIRYWFSLVRNNPAFSKDFKISNEVSEKIQKNYLDRKENFTAEDLDSCIKLGRLYAISCGRNEMLYEDYTHAKELEQLRKVRLEEFNKVVKK